MSASTISISNRTSGTLSGGESQRIRLASQIGSGLSGVLYVLDEPSIGLHQRDNERLLVTLRRLRDLGNTVIVVEHDEDAIRTADYVIDMGPGAGVHGGHVVCHGSYDEILKCETSLTADYLSGRRSVPIPAVTPQGHGQEAHPHRRHRQQSQERHRLASRSAPSPASPASPARASRASPSTRSTPPPPAS